VLIGEQIVDNTTSFPFNPNPDRYKPKGNGAGASSYALNVTDPDFKFPQVWRSNVAVDRKLVKDIVSTTELLYAKDVNGIYYINANLPAAQSTFAGVDARPRWVGTPCVGTGNVGGCATRINSEPGNVVGVNYVLKNGNDGTSWNFAQSLSKTTVWGLMALALAGAALPLHCGNSAMLAAMCLQGVPVCWRPAKAAIAAVAADASAMRFAAGLVWIGTKDR